MNRDYRVGWWLIFLTIALIFGVPLAMSHYLTESMTAAAEYIVSFAGEIALIIPSAIGILYIRFTEKERSDVLPLKRVPPVIMGLAVLTALGAQYFITYVTLPLQMLLITMFGTETATSQMLLPNGALEFVLAFFTLCIAAPLAEEILCRGVLIKLFGKYGLSTALIASSFAFAILHFEARSFVQIFFVGLLLGIFRICTGSMLPCIIMHAANNLLSLCQLMFLQNFTAAAVIGTIIAIAFIPLMYITFAVCKNRLTPDNIPMLRTKPGFSLGACLSVGLFVLVNLGMFIERIININY